MNASKQYSVRDWVKNTAADKQEVAALMEKNPGWQPKHARDLLARRRFIASIKAAGKKTTHHLAPKRGEIKTRCCEKPLWELKHEDGHRLTHKPENCTCLPSGYQVGQWENKKTGKLGKILTR